MNTKTLAIITLVCGILGSVSDFISIIPVIGWLSMFYTPAALIFGSIALTRFKKDGTTKNRGLAIAGIVLAFIKIGLSVLAKILSVIAHSLT